YGFSGLRMLGGELRLNPALPEEWTEVQFYIYWHGQKLEIRINKMEIEVINETKSEAVEMQIYNKKYRIEDRINVKI
ncbi:MAG: hypothetical protein J6C37_02350, partial [Roseburia sp.]|nr:hypothetical protein [Roseburia sp.]